MVVGRGTALTGRLGETPLAWRREPCVSRVAGNTGLILLGIDDENFRQTHSATGATARPQVCAASESRTANEPIRRQLPSRCSKNHSRRKGPRAIQSSKCEYFAARGIIAAVTVLTLGACAPQARRVDPQTGEVLDRLELPAGLNVSGLESNSRDQFFCGGGKSGKIRAVRHPNATSRNGVRWSLYRPSQLGSTPRATRCIDSLHVSA